MQVNKHDIKSQNQLIQVILRRPTLRKLWRILKHGASLQSLDDSMVFLRLFLLLAFPSMTGDRTVFLTSENLKQSNEVPTGAVN